MKILYALMFLVSFQAFALDSAKVDYDFLQDEKGKVLGTQTLVIYYGKCQAQKSFEWKDIQNNSSKISDWQDEVLEQMREGGKCD